MMSEDRKQALLHRTKHIQLSGVAMLHLEDNTHNPLLKKVIPDQYAAELERHGLIARGTGGWVTTDLGHAMIHNQRGGAK